MKRFVDFYTKAEKLCKTTKRELLRAKHKIKREKESTHTEEIIKCYKAFLRRSDKTFVRRLQKSSDLQ